MFLRIFLKVTAFVRKYLFVTLFLLWTLLLIVLLGLLYFDQKTQVERLALKEAEIAFEKDVLYRKWVAIHGGVYVPVTPDTPPNPYLKVKNRDVVTTTGLKLTLVNPAYMTRQVYELAKRSGNFVWGHITSLKPLNPKNSPDPWERWALTLFKEKRLESYWEIIEKDGQKVLRFIRPFITEKSCLKCHGIQGYTVGDIRGGISITVPLNKYYAILAQRMKHIFYVFIAIWFLGNFFLFFGLKLWRHYREEKNRFQERIAQAQKMEALGSLAGGIAHDFNNILTVINGYADSLLKEIPKGPNYEKILAIKRAGSSAQKIIEQLLSFSRGKPQKKKN